MHQKAFRGRAPPGPFGELKRPLAPSARPLAVEKGREKGKEASEERGGERRGNGKGGDGKEGKGRKGGKTRKREDKYIGADLEQGTIAP